MGDAAGVKEVGVKKHRAAGAVPPRTSKWAKPMYLMCGVSNYPPKLRHAPHSGYVIKESAEFVARSAGVHDVLMVLVNEAGEVVSPINTAWNITDRVTQEFRRMYDSGMSPPNAFMLQAFSTSKAPVHVVVGVLRGYNPYYDTFCEAMRRVTAGPQYVQYVVVPASLDPAAAFAALKTCSIR